MSVSLRSNIEEKLESVIEDKHFETLMGLTFEKAFDKKDLLMAADEMNSAAYFITEGSCYSYLSDNNGERQVVQLAIEGNWISDPCSYFSQHKAIYTIEALEPLKTIVLSKQSFNLASNSIPWFDRYFRILIQNAYIAIQYRMAKTNSEETEALYNEFLKLHPHFVQRIPQYIIASYLGVKPQSLSRVRKDIAKKHSA